MARPKTKNAKAVNINMDIKVLEQLEEYCKQTGLSKTVAIERILSDYFTKIEKNKRK